MVLHFTTNTQFILLVVVSKLIIVEAPILAQGPINNLQSTGIKLGLNFNMARTNDALTHVLVLGEEE